MDVDKQPTGQRYQVFRGKILVTNAGPAKDSHETHQQQPENFMRPFQDEADVQSNYAELIFYHDVGGKFENLLLCILRVELRFIH